MFCIGKLVDFPRYRGKIYYGRIKQIYPPRSVYVDFQKSDAYEEGALIRTPSKVELGSYVAYNLNTTGNPELVALFTNVKHESLYRLIRENRFTGDEIEKILQKYCNDECIDEMKKNQINTDLPGEKARKEECVSFGLNNPQSYIDYLKSRGVRYLVHFTPVDNIEGIMKNGLRPRSELKAENKVTDDLRLDSKLDALSLSISFPNYQMFYKKGRE